MTAVGSTRLNSTGFGVGEAWAYSKGAAKQGYAVCGRAVSNAFTNTCGKGNAVVAISAAAEVRRQLQGSSPPPAGQPLAPPAGCAARALAGCCLGRRAAGGGRGAAARIRSALAKPGSSTCRPLPCRPTPAAPLPPPPAQVCANAVAKTWGDSLTKIKTANSAVSGCSNSTGFAKAAASQVTTAIAEAVALATAPCASAAAFVRSEAFAEAIVGEWRQGCAGLPTARWAAWVQAAVRAPSRLPPAFPLPTPSHGAPHAPCPSPCARPRPAPPCRHHRPVHLLRLRYR